MRAAAHKGREAGTRKNKARANAAKRQARRNASPQVITTGEWLSVPTAAIMLGISASTLRRRLGDFRTRPAVKGKGTEVYVIH